MKAPAPHARRLRAAIAACGLIATAALTPAAALAQAPAAGPLIADYGKTTPVPNASERPDPRLDYKVVFSVTKSGGDAEPPPALDKAARLANLLAQSGVDAAHRHIVVIFYGPATTAVLNPAGVKARGKASNPSAEAIDELSRAGVSVRVCGQALAGAKINRDEVLPQVQVDLSAVTTLATLQLRGYALLPD
jgi:intracellular sulfur oxidation DsrE/DsrF family protein